MSLSLLAGTDYRSEWVKANWVCYASHELLRMFLLIKYKWKNLDANATMMIAGGLSVPNTT